MANFRLSARSSRLTQYFQKSAKPLSLVIVIAVGLASTGCKKVVVPNVAQQDLDQAKQTLTAAQLKPGTITGAQVPGAYVVDQTPGAGQQVSGNTAINLTVEAPVAVPDLTKNKVTDAVSALQLAGLQVTFIKQPTLKLFGGANVVAQSPPPNTSVHRNSIVTITVAAPPDWGSLATLVTKEPAYNKLDPQYRQVLDSFLK